jgi:hypothetical protein
VIQSKLGRAGFMGERYSPAASQPGTTAVPSR